VARTAGDRGPSHDGGPMIGFLLNNSKSHESETGRGN
jgi:hypothetical protein